MKDDKNRWLVVCDGGKRNGIAYGSYKVFTPELELYAHRFMMFGFGTSNVAEYMAFINAVDFCIRNQIDKVKIQSDSALMLNQVQGNWRTKDNRLKKLRGIARTKLNKVKDYKLEKLPNKEVKKILGH